MKCRLLGPIHATGDHPDVYHCNGGFKVCTLDKEMPGYDGPLAVCANCLKFKGPRTGKDVFDRVVVINLERRTDRREAIEAEFSKGWPFVAPVFQKAIDGQRVQCPPKYTQGNNVWACLQSHRHAIEDAINDGCESVLVLEDDAILADGFADKALQFMRDIPDDWEFAWFGGHHYHCQPTYVKPGVVKTVNVDRMHAYAARGKGLTDLYRFWHQWHDGHCDHALNKAKWFQTRQSYAVHPWLVGQRGGPSDVCYAGPAKPVINGENWWHQVAPGVTTREKPPQLVGTEVSKILKSLDIDTDSCEGCKQMVERMDRWGVSGCLLPKNKAQILNRLRSKASEASWATKLKAAALSLTNGLAGQVTWTDPAPGIFAKAIANVVNRAKGL